MARRLCASVVKIKKEYRRQETEYRRKKFLPEVDPPQVEIVIS